MKKIFRIMALVMVAMILAGSMVGFAAERNPIDILKKSVWGDGRIELIMYADVQGGLTADNLTVKTDDIVHNTKEISSYGNNGTSWVLLVDISSVATDKTDAPIRGMIDKVYEGLTNKDGNIIDNMYVVMNGDSYDNVAIRRITDENAKNEAKDRLKYNAGNEMLYSTLGNVLSYISSNSSDFKSRINIIILSDGHTPVDNDTYVNQISQANVGIYPVSFSGDAEDENSAKYEEIAYLSKGGIAIKQPAKGDADSVLTAIKENESKLYRVVVDPRTEQNVGSKLEVTVKAGGQIFYDDVLLQDYEVKAIVNAFTQTTPEPTVGPATTDTGIVINDGPGDDIDDIIETPWWKKTVFMGLTVLHVIIIGGSIITIAAVALIIILVAVGRSRKNSSFPPAPPMPVFDKSAGGPPDSPFADAGNEPTSYPGRAMNETRPVFGNEGRPAYANETRPAYNPAPVISPVQMPVQAEVARTEVEAPIQVTMNQIGGAGKSYTAYMSDELYVGRDARNCQVAVEGDGKISGRHMQLTFDGVNMMVTDCNSTNGTRVNNRQLPKNRPIVINQQDVITIGTTSLKITWWVRR